MEPVQPRLKRAHTARALLQSKANLPPDVLLADVEDDAYRHMVGPANVVLVHLARVR